MNQSDSDESEYSACYQKNKCSYTLATSIVDLSKESRLTVVSET